MSDPETPSEWVLEALEAIRDNLNSHICGYHFTPQAFIWDVQYGRNVTRPEPPRVVEISLPIGRACFCPNPASGCDSSPQCGEVFASRTYPLMKSALKILLVLVPREGDPREFVESTENQSYTPDLDELTWRMMLNQQSCSEITNTMNNYYNDLAVVAARNILRIWEDACQRMESPEWDDASEAIVREQITETSTRCCRDMDEVEEIMERQN